MTPTRTTIWRPNVKVTLNEDGEVERHGAGRRGGDEEGDEAEESPSHKGAMRARGDGRSKVCNACPHGKWRSRCKERQPQSRAVGAL